MKILIFCAYYFPEIAASLYLTEDLVKKLADNKCNIELYTPSPSRGISDATYKEYKKIKLEIKYSGYVRIHRIRMFKEPKKMAFRILRYILLDFKFFVRGLFAKCDVIFSYSTPPIQGLMCSVLKFFKRKPFIYCLQDIFPDSMLNSQMITKKSIAWKLGRCIEKYTYKHSNKIIAISKDFENNLLNKKVSSDKIEVIPNWADIGNIQAVSRENNVLFKKYNLDPNLFYFSYSGNIGYTQNIFLLLEAAKYFEDAFPKIRFVLIGDGSAKKECLNKIISEHISNVVVLPFQSYNDISDVFSLGDVGIIISKRGIGSNSVPSKTWNYMAAQVPILCSFDKNSELSNLVKTTSCGVVCEADDKTELINSIVFLYNNFDLLKQYGINGYNYVTKTLNKEECLNKYLSLLTSL